MVRYSVRTDAELADFTKKYIPPDCTVRIPGKNENPLLDPKNGETGVYTIFFVQAGFTLPLDPLLYRFMWDTGLSLGQISPNAMRVILGCSALNEKLGVKLTPREIFYCYQFCKCPGEDNYGLYLRARPKMPDLVKCLTNSEKDFQKDVLCIGGNWKGLDSDGKARVGIHTFRNRAHANPKKTPCSEVDFQSINTVLQYNGEFFRVQSRHLRAAHILLGYTPVDTNWLPERGNQPTELGPVAERPSKSKGKGKRKIGGSAPARVASGVPVAENIVLGPPGVVTATGSFDVEAEIEGVTLAQSRDKGAIVDISPDVSEGEDPERTPSDQEADDWVEQTFEYLRNMPIQRKSLMGDAPSVTPPGNQGGPSSTSASQKKTTTPPAPEKTPPPPAPRQKKRKRVTSLRDEPTTPPPANIDPAPTLVRTPSDGQQQLVTFDPTHSTPATQSSEEWHPTFELRGRPLHISDSPFRSPAVAVSLIAGITKFEDVERESRKAGTKLRDEMLQHLIVGGEMAAILDNKRLEQIEKLSDLLVDRDESLNKLKGELDQRKKDNNSLTIENQKLVGEAKDLQEKFGSAQSALSSKDKEISDLKVQYTKELEDLKKQHSAELEELKKKKASELDEAEQRGYDIGFMELSAELEVIKKACYQAGYNFGLDILGASVDSEHRHSVSLPEGFNVRDHIPVTQIDLTSEAPTSDNNDPLDDDAQIEVIPDSSAQQSLDLDPASQQPLNPDSSAQ